MEFFDEKMMIDKAGAEFYRRQQLKPPGFVVPSLDDHPEPSTDQTTVTVYVQETHDGIPCECIPAQQTVAKLSVGDRVVLTHDCHDGRHDEVAVTIVSIERSDTVVRHMGWKVERNT